MKIFPAEPEHFPLMKQFIEPHEYKCVLLASYVRKKSKNLFIICTENWKKDEASGSICTGNLEGILYFDKTILHCIPDISNPEKKDEFEKVFLEFLGDRQIRCIDGEKNGTDFIAKICLQKGQLSIQTNNYNLMICKNINQAPEKLSDDDEIKRCTGEDLECLLELQREYICKEVAPKGKNPTAAEISIGLRQILKNQLCLCIFSDDKPVSKANTNAIGINWVQLGGIYTHPLYRRNYYAWHLVTAICRRVAKSGKKTALFVKNMNIPAIDLYKRIGFEEAGEFEIVYY